MPSKQNCMGAGMSSHLANQVVGGTPAAIIAAANNTQTGAALLTFDSYISVVSSSGKSALLPACNPGDIVYVYNNGANTANIFGQVGEGIGAGAVNAAYALATVSQAIFRKITATLWAVTKSN